MKMKRSQIFGFLTGLFFMGAISLLAGATFSRVKNWSSNDILTASDLNAEFNNILTNLTPVGVDDYSLNTTQMRTVTDPYPANTEDAPTSLAGELANLRYQILEIKKAIQPSNVTYWYQDAPSAGTFTIAASSVGINNVSPAYALDVVGGVHVSTGAVFDGDVSIAGRLSYTQSASNFSYVAAAISSTTVSQAFTSSPEQIMFDQEVHDTLGEYDPSVSTFTALYSGTYLVTATVLDSTDTAHGATLAVYVNGNRRHRTWAYIADSGVVTNGSSAHLSVVISLVAGDYVSFFYQPSGETNLTSLGCFDDLTATLTCSSTMAIVRLQ